MLHKLNFSCMPYPINFSCFHLILFPFVFDFPIFFNFYFVFQFFTFFISRIDGLKSGPIYLGDINDTEGWWEVAKPAIEAVNIFIFVLIFILIFIFVLVFIFVLIFKFVLIVIFLLIKCFIICVFIWTSLIEILESFTCSQPSIPYSVNLSHSISHSLSH